MRDRPVHLYERSLLASIITPVLSFRNWLLTGPSLLGLASLVKFLRKTAQGGRLSVPSLPLGKRIRCRRGFFGYLPTERNGAASSRAGPPQHNRRGDKDRGISPDNHADNNGKGKVAQHWATEEKQAKNRDQRHRAGKNRATERLVNTFVHDLLDRTTASTGQAFPDPVVDDNGVVNRVAGNRQDGADHGESELAAQQREHTDGHKDIVQECDNRPHRKGKLKAKSYED